MPNPITADVAFALTGDVRTSSRALRQLRALAGRGLTVAVLTLGSGPVGVAGVRAVGRGGALGGGPLFYLRNHAALSAWLRRVRARVWHASDLYALPAMARARGRGAALTYDARECYPHVFGTVGRPLARRFWQALEGAYVRRCNAVWTVSPSIACHMARVYGIAPPAFLPNADPPAAPPADRHRLHRRLGLPPGAPLVVYAGALTPRRGLERLARAWPAVAAACPDAHLVYVGGGPLGHDLEALARQTERVWFTGSVAPAEMTALVASAAVGVALLDDVCLNHRLALPNKLFAYLGAGVPVVASDLPEMRRLLAGPPPAGLLAAEREDELSGALVTLLSDPGRRARLAAAAPDVLETTDAAGALHRFADTLADLAARP